MPDDNGNANNEGAAQQGAGDATPPPINPMLGGLQEGAKAAEALGENSEKPDWFIGPDIPGKGEKPDWFNNKKFTNIFEQAKSQEHLRKMLGQRTGAPEEYDIELGKLGKDYENVKIDKDDPLLTEFSKFAKKEKLSQEGFDEALKMFVDYSNLQNSRETEQLADFQRQELEALGGPEEAKKQIGEMTQWFKQNFPDFKPGDFQDLMYFAGGVKILKAMREKMRYAAVPSSSGDNGRDNLDADELKQMIGDKRYESDPVYQKKVDELYQRKYG